MRKEIILAITLILIVGITGFVYSYKAESLVDFDDGWNLVYGFVDPIQQLEDQPLEASNIKAIYVLIPTTQEYARVYPNPEENKIPKDLIESDYLINTAFWVYAERTTITKYWVIEDIIPYNERQIYKGWNFVGVTPEMISQSQLNDIKGTCDIEKSYVWDNEHQKWMEYPLTNKFDNNNMVSIGWVIKVSDNCNLGASSGGVSPPPALPGGSYVPNQCAVTAPFYCNAWTVSTTAINLELKNVAGETLNVRSVKIDGCGTYSVPTNILDGYLNTFIITCDSMLTSGAKFQGDITITYRKSGSTTDLTSIGKLVENEV